MEHAATLNQIELFEPLLSGVTQVHSAVIPVAKEAPVDAAKRRIRQIILDGHGTVCAYSGGKDSSALASLLLDVATEMLQEGLFVTPIIMVHSNTGVENPETSALAIDELKKMKAYAIARGIDLDVRVGKPTLNSAFPARVIGGRGLPSFPDNGSSCSTDWKVAVNTRLVKQAFKALGNSPDLKAPVIMTGVRQSESGVRDRRIATRGEVAEGLWTNDHGHLRASPILDWSTDDVWEYLGLCSAGVYDSYSDFSDVMQIYRSAGGSSCVVVADMKLAQRSTGCSARTGCWTCVKMKNDKSMESMIETEPERYGYMRPLSAVRDFISLTQYDWSRRQFVGRTIDENGTLAIQADTYSPNMLMELLGYCLTAQIESGVQIIDYQSLVAIDARWSLYGFHPPFSALKLFFQIEDEGLRMHPPKLARFPKTDVPRLGRLFVGAQWSEQGGPLHGLRNVAREMHAESCGLEMKVLTSGNIVIDDEADDGVDVDLEGATDFVEFFGREMVGKYCNATSSDWTHGYMTYLTYGTISVSKGKSRQVDEILRRTQWRQENGLHGQVDIEALKSRLDSQACAAPHFEAPELEVA